MCVLHTHTFVHRLSRKKILLAYFSRRIRSILVYASCRILNKDFFIYASFWQFFKCVKMATAFPQHLKESSAVWAHFLALNAFLFLAEKKKPLYKSLWEDRAYQEGSLAVYTFSLYPPLLRPRLLSSFFPSSRRLRGKRKILKVREELQPRMSVHFFLLSFFCRVE